MKSMLAAALAVATICGCGSDTRAEPSLPRTAPGVGPTARHRPPSLAPRAAHAQPIAGLRCTRGSAPRYGVHLELFAARRVVLIPPGVGIAPPRERRGAYVRGGRCSYPRRTREPTGVIEVTERGHTLADVFAVWGQPLTRNRMAGFHGRVQAYVSGRS